MPSPRHVLGCSLIALGLTSLGLGLRAPATLSASPHGGAQQGERVTSRSELSSAQSQSLSNSIVAMEVLRVDHGSEIYVSNRLAGPLEVNVQMSGAQGVMATPALPVRQLLAAQQRVLISRVEQAANQFPSFSVNAVPGDPHAIPSEVSYGLPLDEDANWEVGQAFHGGFSHTDEENRYAVDLIVPVGTPVLAARDGVVMQVESGYDSAGTNRKVYAERANVVRVMHDDGTMAVYAHLRENGVLVGVGERVGVGQQIAFSGNTGYSSGPHLHFCLQVNTGMRLVSIPFRMVTSRGFLPLPRR